MDSALSTRGGPRGPDAIKSPEKREEKKKEAGATQTRELTQFLPHGEVTGEEAFADGSAHLGGLGRGETLLLLDKTPQVLPGKLCRLPPAVTVAHGKEGHRGAAATAAASGWRGRGVQGRVAGRRRAFSRWPNAGKSGARRLPERPIRYRRRLVLRSQLRLHHNLSYVLHVLPPALVREDAHSQRVQPRHGRLPGIPPFPRSPPNSEAGDTLAARRPTIVYLRRRGERGGGGPRGGGGARCRDLSARAGPVESPARGAELLRLRTALAPRPPAPIAQIRRSLTPL